MKFSSHIGLAAFALSVGTAANATPTASATDIVHPSLGNRAVVVIEQNGLRFRDLNRDGQMNPFEDWCLTPEARAKDLVTRMNARTRTTSLAVVRMKGVSISGPVRLGMIL